MCVLSHKTITADWEGRAIHYERPVQKLTSFSLKHYQIIFRQYFFGWSFGVCVCVCSGWCVCVHFISCIRIFLYCYALFSLSAVVCCSCSGSSFALSLCVVLFACAYLRYGGNGKYMQPKNGLCVSLFRLLIQCRLHISLYIPRVCYGHKRTHTHTHTRSCPLLLALTCELHSHGFRHREPTSQSSSQRSDTRVLVTKYTHATFKWRANDMYDDSGFFFAPICQKEWKREHYT